MLVKNVVRGNQVNFTTRFYDANNTVLNPSDPTLTLYYKSNGSYITVTANLIYNSNSNFWASSWDSANADAGIVMWHISGGPGVPAAEDGEFRVLSNRANGGPGAS